MNISILIPYRDRSFLFSFALLVFGTAMLLISIGYLSHSRDQITNQAQTLLQADIRVTTSYPNEATEKILGHAKEIGLKTCPHESFFSNGLVEGSYTLFRIFGVSACYPLKGWIEITHEDGIERYSEKNPLPLSSNTVYIESQRGFFIGDTVVIAENVYTISGLISARSNAIFNSASIAPLVIMDSNEVTRLGLLSEGSRVSYRYSFTGTESQLNSFRTKLKPTDISGGYRIEDITSLKSLSITPLITLYRIIAIYTFLFFSLSILFFVFGTAPTLNQEKKLLALLFDYGVSPAKRWYFLGLRVMSQTILLASITIPIALVVSLLLPDYFPTTASYLLLSFALLVTISVFLLVIRIDISQSFDRLLAIPIAVVLALSLSFFFTLVTFSFTFLSSLLALLSVVLVAAILIWFQSAAMRRLSATPLAPPWLLLASIARRSEWRTTATTLALTVVLVSISLAMLLDRSFANASKKISRSDLPNTFVMGISVDEVEPIKNELSEIGVSIQSIKPLYRGNLIAINELSPDSHFSGEVNNRSASREFNISTDDYVEGFSLEEKFAARLNLKIGDTLLFSLYGVSIEAPVTELRSVQWESFEPNFFILADPALLSDLPHSYITSVHLTEDLYSSYQNIMLRYPNVTNFFVTQMLKAATELLMQTKLLVFILSILVFIIAQIALVALTVSSISMRRMIRSLLYDHGLTIKRQQRYYLGELALFFSLSALPAIIISWFLFRWLEDILSLSERLPILTIASTIVVSSSVLVIALVLTVSTVRLPPAETQ